MKQNKKISRREFTKMGIGAAVMASGYSAKVFGAESTAGKVRLGGPIETKEPDVWVKNLKKLGYSAAYCPVGADASDDVVKAYATAAEKGNIVIAEVGAWSNPISPNSEQCREAQAHCRNQLALGDRIGAMCCVNISGSRNKDDWAGPHEDNLTGETFDLIIEVTRGIIDDVKPKRTYFTLEMMAWSYPNSVDSYIKLMKAIDRKQFAVHLDPTNIVCSPEIYYHNGKMIKECFAKLGPYIRSCHGKDVILGGKALAHLDEIRPGLGRLDYAVFLKELSKLKDIPLMLEHLDSQEEYRKAADYVRSVGKKIGVDFV
jgi:sugar phosphate isomerase/epimerase